VTANNLPYETMMRIVSGDWVAVLSPRGAALVELRNGETVVTTSSWAGASQWFSGSTLFPWVNRLADGAWRLTARKLQAPINDNQNNCANHGLVFDRGFRIVARTDNAITLAITLEPGDAYPAALDLTVNYTLTDSGLTVTYEVANPGHTRLPFAIGGHPYLLADQDSVLEFEAQGRVEVDGRLLPTEISSIDRTPTVLDVANRKHYTDACFTGLTRDASGRASVRLSRPSANLTVTLWQDEAFTHLQVFTLQTGRSERRNLVALEPQTAAANALNTGDGLIWLDAGQNFTGSWGITIGAN
jgi:aldose 1-epimerase